MSILKALSPEIFLLGMISIILLTDLFFKSRQKNLIYGLTQFSMLGVLGLSLMLWSTHPRSLDFFHQMFVLDSLSLVLKILIVLSSFFVFWVSKNYIESRKIPVAEFYLLGMFAILGMMLLVSTHHLIVLFLALELSALPVYALTALWQESPYGQEAAMKYFVLGAMASGLLLYGLSMMYGASGSLDMTVIAHSPLLVSNHLLFVFALVFIFAGIAFKLGAAPFHLWVPDVYTGAPTAITLFISAAPKIAALGMTFRFLVDAFPALQPQCQQLLIVIAIVSMGLGNFAAIVQTNLKRMLGYSSVAHMGYMSLGLIAGTQEGYSASLFYMMTYALMVIGAFGLLTLLSTQKEIETLSDLKGLNSKNPWLAFMLLLILFSMAGIPVSAGFFAKLGVLLALIHVHFVWLAVLAIVFAVIGAYYYINVVKAMYFEKPSQDDSSAFVYPYSLSVVITVSGLGILLLGIFPGMLIRLSQMVF